MSYPFFASGTQHSLGADGFSLPALRVLAVLCLLAFLAETSGLDVWLENHYFDSTAHFFPLRNAPLYSHVLHDGLRKLMVASLTLLLLGLLLARYITALQLPSFWRQPRLLPYLATVFLGGPLIVGLLKQVTTRACPWSLSMYGGSLPYGDILHEPFFSLNTPGHCFPGAHAITGFVLFAFVPLLPHSRRWLFALFVLAFGLTVGWVQVVRGAHFLSHNLWSTVIGWLVMWLAWKVIRPGHDTTRLVVEDVACEVAKGSQA